jgi:heme exporter protein D
MTSLGPHAAYILISYAFTALVIAALMVRSLSAYRRARRRLAMLDTIDPSSK